MNDDLISRQAAIATAIKAAVDWHKLANPQYSIAYCIGEAMRQLPPTQLGTNLAEVGTDAVSREAVKELAYSQIRSMYCGVALKEQRETMLRIADNVIGLLAPVASKQPEIVRCKDCKYWVPGYITDNDDFIPPKCGEWQQMVGHSSNDYCSLAERREVTT